MSCFRVQSYGHNHDNASIWTKKLHAFALFVNKLGILTSTLSKSSHFIILPLLCTATQWLHQTPAAKEIACQHRSFRLKEPFCADRQPLSADKVSLRGLTHYYFAILTHFTPFAVTICKRYWPLGSDEVLTVPPSRPVAKRHTRPLASNKRYDLRPGAVNDTWLAPIRTSISTADLPTGLMAVNSPAPSAAFIREFEIKF